MFQRIAAWFFTSSTPRRIEAGKKHLRQHTGRKVFMMGIAIGFILSEIKNSLSRGSEDYDIYNYPPSTVLRASNQEEIKREADRNKKSTDDFHSSGDGWNNIGVYYGNNKHLGGANDKSQCGQDTIVKGLHSQRRGLFFLDLAANDATHFSNSFRLEQDLGWHGLCFEPNPIYWPRLAQRKCKVVAAVVGDTVGEEIDFMMHSGAKQASGGIVGNDFDNKLSRPKTNSKPFKLFTTTLVDTFMRYGVPTVINYLSLDIEGAEYFVMKDFPFDQYKIEVLTIERPKQILVDLLYDKGYQYIAASNAWGMETLWVHSSAVPQLDMSIFTQVLWTKGTTKYLQVDKDSSKTPTVIWVDKKDRKKIK